MTGLYIKIIFILLFLSSCFKDSPKEPVDVLRAYVQLYASPNTTKQQFLEFLTGALYDDLDALSSEEFEQYLKEKDYQKRNVKIVRENCLAEVCYITYTLNYSKKDQLTLDSKKIAEFKKIGGRWKISSVDDIKTYIEYKKNLNMKL